MKAIIIDAFGGPEKLQYTDIPNPILEGNDVLIKVAYAGVNPVDWKIREGLLKDRLPHEFPLIMGWDVSGVVSEIGSNVDDFKVGDEVFSYVRKPIVKWGAYAEFVTMDAEYVAKKPKNSSFAEAAAVPLIGLTAWQALFTTAHLQRGETVLILGGSGGVGSMAVQFAKSMGANVLATASLKNHDYVKKLGATEVFDHGGNVVEQVQNFTKGGVDVVFDCFGKEAFRNGLSCLKKGGRIVSILEHLEPEEAKKLGIVASYLFVSPNGHQLKNIAHLINEKKVQAPSIEEMPLKDAAIAQEKIRTKSTSGKIVLKV